MMRSVKGVSAVHLGKYDGISLFVMHFSLENIFISMAISLELPEERQIVMGSQQSLLMCEVKEMENGFTQQRRGCALGYTQFSEHMHTRT